MVNEEKLTIHGSFVIPQGLKKYNQSHELIFSYAGVAVIDRPKFFLPQKRLMEKSEMYPESDRTEDK